MAGIIPRLTIQEADGSPSGRFATLKMPNASLTDNGDGSVTYAAASGGGQTLVTKVVAASGGDYTTLGAALTAASDGWTIFVKDATTESGTITDSHNSITIIGMGAEVTAVALGANVMTLSGTNVRIQNLGFTATTGGIVLSGTGAEFIGNHYYKTGATTVGLTATAATNLIADNILSSTTTTTLQHFSLGGVGSRVINNQFVYVANNSSSMTMASGSNTAGCLFANNVIKINTSSSHLTALLINDHCSVTGNTITCATAGDIGISLNFNGNRSTATGNTFVGGRKAASLAGQTNTFSENAVQMDSISTNVNVIVTSGTYCTVNGNNIDDQDGGRSVATIAIGGAGNVFSGNVVNRSSTNSSPVVTVTNSTVTVSGNYLSQGSTASGASVVSTSQTDVVITGNYMGMGGTATSFIKFGAGNSVAVGNRFQPGSQTTPIDFSTFVGIEAYNNGVGPFFNRRIMRMKNTSGSTINAGNIVILKNVAGGQEVTTTTTASDNLVFGMAEASIANNAFGYILVEGATVLLTVNGTADIAIGDFITTYTAAGIGQKGTVGTLSTTPGSLAIAIALEAYTTDDSNGVIDAVLITPRRL